MNLSSRNNLTLPLSISFPIHYPLITLSLNITQSEIQIALLNKQQSFNRGKERTEISDNEL
jgi:hypothetical protein